MYPSVYQEIHSQQFLHPTSSMFALQQNVDQCGTQGRWSVSEIPKPLPSKVKVELYNEKLWQRFHRETTEMIITKLGRRMFPTLQLTISGLDAQAYYNIALEITPASEHRLKYCGNQDVYQSNNNKGWTVAGPAELQPPIDNRIYLHPDNPAVGAHWMLNPVKFDKLKLTNNAIEHRHNVVLTSMHKYIPRIWIIRCDSHGKSINAFYSSPSSSFMFKQTEFIAVTAYQNDNITKMKIENNPFAKGFRESGRSRCKRKFRHSTRMKIEDEEDENSSCKNESITSTNDMDSSSTVSKMQTENIDDACNYNEKPSTTVSSSGIFSITVSSPGQEDNHETQSRFHRPWLNPRSFCRESMLSSSLSSSSVPSQPRMYSRKRIHNMKEISDMQDIYGMQRTYGMKMPNFSLPFFKPFDCTYPYHATFYS